MGDWFGFESKSEYYMSDRGKVPWVTFLLTQKIVYMKKNYTTLKIRETDYVIGFNVHALLMFEKLTNANQSFSLKTLKDFCTPKSLEGLCKLFYCFIVGNRPKLELPYEVFLEALDLQPFKLTEFADWLDTAIEEEFFIGRVEFNEN